MQHVASSRVLGMAIWRAQRWGGQSVRGARTPAAGHFQPLMQMLAFNGRQRRKFDGPGGEERDEEEVGLGRTERVAIAHAAASEGGPRMQLGEQQASANKAVALSVVPVMANGGINNSRKNSNPRPREKIRRKRPNERQTAGRRYTLLRQLPLLAGYLHQLQQRSVPTNLGWFGITCSPAASIIADPSPCLPWLVWYHPSTAPTGYE